MTSTRTRSTKQTTKAWRYFIISEHIKKYKPGGKGNKMEKELNNQPLKDPETEKNDALRERAAENVEQFFCFIDKIQSDAYKPIKTGLNFYDELTGGARPQTLTILLAAQKAGKSMLFAQLAEALALQHARHIVYLNFEMSREQLLARAISARIKKRGNIQKSMTDILEGYKWNDAERREILAAIDEYKMDSLPYISYNPEGIQPTVENIEAYLKELEETPAPPHLFVDYLQLIQGEKHEDIKDRLTHVLIMLKDYAVKANASVFLISAVNRNSKEHITASSARDTSSIEYQADALLSLELYKDQEIAERKGLARMELKLLNTRFGESDRHAILYRDGRNNLFYGEYKGKYNEDLPEWLDDQDDNAIDIN